MYTKFNLRLLQKFGLSMSTKKQYHIVYDPQTWHIMGVYDDFELAIKEGFHETLEQYNEFKKKGVSYKGFCHHLSVWETLEHLSNFIEELNYDETDPTEETKKDNQDFVLSRIESKLQSYPEYIRENNTWASI